ncbi:ABC transporter permease [Spirosoma agri]|uniref:FtsX-like permease family protein n=1 Tax=Spirosoma agri TaxID=1987381 RepID=A0A6M0IS74_9BACT|nr:ABC transporter permease [Spirosoma agri]NEU70827.1 FtsX-like permease family protein [Spirosoma agri]
MIRNHFKIAWRNLLHQKLYSLITIGSLTIAITAVLLIMMWIQNELRFDAYQPNADRTFLVTNQEQTDITQSTLWEHSPYPLAATMTRQFPEVELVAQMARSQPNEVNLQVSDRIFTQDYVAYVDDNWFKLFQYEVLEGTLAMFSAHPHSLILTESKAKTLFGLTQVAGHRVRIDSTDYLVKAVIKDNPVNSSFQFEVILPLVSTLNTQLKRDEANNWLYPTHRTFVRLQPHTNVALTARKITQLYEAHRDKKNLTAGLLPVQELHFQNGFKVSAFAHGDRTTVTIFILLATLLLLTACINYVNLSVARTSVRSKEIGVRKIVGASRVQLFWQIIAECILTSGLALGLAQVLVSASLPAFNQFVDRTFSFNPMEWHTAGLLLGCWVAMLLLISVYPALLLSSINPLHLFRGSVFFRVKSSSFRQVLTTSQFGLAVVMILGTIGIYRQLWFMQTQHKGYDRRQLFTVQVPREQVTISSFDESKAYHQRLESRLQLLKQDLQAQSPIKEVVRMNMTSVVDNGYTTSGGIDWDGRPANFQPAYISYAADEDLNKVMPFDFSEGRWFDPQLRSDQDNVVLNETAVKQFGLTSPVVGKRFNQGKIIGVVRDFYHQNLHEKIAPVIIRTNLPNQASFLIETRSGQVSEALETTLASFRKQFPHESLIYTFTDQEFDKLYRDDQKALKFTLWFCGLSILIACMGLLAMMTFAIEQRQKEIGVRKVLGASVRSIVMLLSNDFLRQMAIAIVLASPIAMYCLNRWLERFAYRITPEWWMVVLAGLLATSVALLTISVQSVKAATTNPVKTLRRE